MTCVQEVCMLSAAAIVFLKSIFNHRCTASRLFPVDLLMQDTGPSSLFHNAPPAVDDDDHPLGRSNMRQLLVRGTDTRYLPLESFLAVWAYCTLINTRRTIMAMMYLGYPDGYGRCVMSGSCAFFLLFSVLISRVCGNSGWFRTVMSECGYQAALIQS